MPISPLPDVSLATADLLREEEFRLRKILSGLEEENGKLASQLLAWQKWYKTSYAHSILFLEQQVISMSSSVADPSAETPALADTSAASPSETSSKALLPLLERPEIVKPPLLVRGANGALAAPGYGEVVTYSDDVLKKIQEHGEKSRRQVAAPLQKQVAPQPQKKGQLSDEQQAQWDIFLARQTTEAYGVSMSQSVEKKSEVAEYRQQLVATNLGFHGLQGLRKILRQRFGGSLIEGWRVGLSPHGRKRIGFAEMCTALNQTVGFAGNLRDLWLELCPRHRGTIGIEDLDPRGAAEVAKLREVLIAQHESIYAAWTKVFKSNEASKVSSLNKLRFASSEPSADTVDEDEFTRACGAVGFSGNAKRAFHFLKHREADGMYRVSVNDLDPGPGPDLPKVKPWRPSIKKPPAPEPPVVPALPTPPRTPTPVPTPPRSSTPPPPVDEEALAAAREEAATKIQSLQRGKRDRILVEQLKAERAQEEPSDDDAFKYDPEQGKAARRKAKEMLVAQAESSMLKMFIQVLIDSRPPTKAAAQS